MDEAKFQGVPRIGLTGGIASGKSEVAALLRVHGTGPAIDVDRICRDLLLPDASAWRQLMTIFGPGYFNRDRTVARAKLRRAIFRDPLLRQRLDEIMHPLAREVLLQRLAVAKEPGGIEQGGIVVVEVPLLYEAGWQELFDRVVVVYADHRTALERLMRRDGCGPREAEAALAGQWPLKEKAMLADHVIDNSGGRSRTILQVRRLLDLLTSPARGGKRP